MRQRRLQGQKETGNHSIAAIILAALLSSAALAVLVRMPAVGGAPQITVEERGGAYDLSNMGNLGDAVVTLPPGTFYPGVYLAPEAASDAAPQSAQGYGGERTDYLTQRFVLKLPDTEDIYALSFQVSGRHAMRVYVNGALVGQTGKLGLTNRDTEVWENNLTCYAAPKDGKMDIILHSAQFAHFRFGARLSTLRLYRAAPGLSPPGFSRVLAGFAVMGALLCAAVLLLCIYLLQQRAKALLYFALACLAMALRECIQSQAWVHLGFLTGKLSFMLEYLSMAMLGIFLTLYLAQILTDRFARWIKRISLTGSAIYAACLLLGDSIFYTSVLGYYQALLVVCIVCGMGDLFRTMRRPNAEQAAALYGILVFYLAAVSDILMYSNVLTLSAPKASTSEAAMLVFVLAQTVSLFLMNNRLVAQAKEAEQKLVGEKEMLERLNQMKAEFLGNISHELKTPLTVISSQSQYARSRLPRQPQMEEADRALKLIEGEAARMGMMVSQLLDISRIAEGRMPMDLKEESLVEIIQTTLNQYYPHFEKNHNRLIFRLEGDAPQVCCDRRRMAQVLVNLIANAARHTHQGTITVSTGAKGEEAFIVVADTGEGIAPENIPSLFTRYYTQTADEKARAGWDTGTGLGLTICKYIVQAHGGAIAVESTLGKGTSVTVKLPICAAPAGDANPEGEPGAPQAP